jgi:glutaredoxin
MVLMIGNEGCSRCKVTQDILTSKGIPFKYQLISELDGNDAAVYLAMAKAAKQTSFPILIKDDLVVTLQEVIG